MPGSVHAQAPDRRARPEIVNLFLGQESATPETLTRSSLLGGTRYLAIERAFSLTLALTHGPIGRCRSSDVKTLSHCSCERSGPVVCCNRRTQALIFYGRLIRYPKPSKIGTCGSWRRRRRTRRRSRPTFPVGSITEMQTIAIPPGSSAAIAARAESNSRCVLPTVHVC